MSNGVHLIIENESTEPTIGEVKLDLLAQLALDSTGHSEKNSLSITFPECPSQLPEASRGSTYV
jgi:hypothetical protein